MASHDKSTKGKAVSVVVRASRIRSHIRGHVSFVHWANINAITHQSDKMRSNYSLIRIIVDIHESRSNRTS